MTVPARHSSTNGSVATHGQQSRASSVGALIDLLYRIRGATPGEQPLLINELYDFPVRAVEPVLLQAVHLAMTLASDDNQRHLRRFLWHLACSSVLLGLRLSWALDAVAPAFTTLGLGARVTDVRTFIEPATVNKHLSVKRGGEMVAIGSPPDASASPEALQLEVVRKEARLGLFNRQRAFVAALTSISSALVKVSDRSKRKAELHRLLEELNAKAVQGGRVFFPLCHSDDRLRWIVNICVKECAVFSSRERAPYLILFETITDQEALATDPSVSRITDPCAEAQRPQPPATSGGGGDSHLGVRDGAGSSHARTHSRILSCDFSLPEGEGKGLIERVYGESTDEKRARIRAASPYGKHPHWSTAGVIVKAGDDLKQEELALQLIELLNTIFTDAKLTLCLKPYSAVSTTPDGGVIECVADASSIDGVKKAAGVQSLHQYFVAAYGGEASTAYSAAQRNFVESMAGYSVACYLLQIKDRHNGNLMLTRAGHVVHIDFGFMLATSPGGVRFERAPFKLSQELMDVMGGPASPSFQYFKILVMQGMLAARARAREVLALIEIMTTHNTLPCFGPDPLAVVRQVEGRFRLDLRSEAEYALYVRELIAVSVDNWRTKRYDQFQTLQNGII